MSAKRNCHGKMVNFPPPVPLKQIIQWETLLCVCVCVYRYIIIEGLLLIGYDQILLLFCAFQLISHL